MADRDRKHENRKLKAYSNPAGPASRKEASGPWEILLAGDFQEKHSELLQSLLEVAAGSEGILYFDSNGGSVYTALSLIAIIRLRKLRPVGVVLGECSSAAVLPFAVCQQRYVMPYSTLLFHPMKWESEENVRLKEAAEWARHFQEIDRQFDQLLIESLGISPELLQNWSEPGRFVSGQELAAAGLADLITDKPDRLLSRLQVRQ